MESGALYSSVEEVARMVDSVPNEEHSEEPRIASLKQLDACEGASSTLFKAIKDPRPMKLKFVKSGAAHGGVEHLQEPSEYQRRASECHVKTLLRKLLVNSDARFTGSFVEHDALEEEARLNAATVELMNVLSISTRPPAAKAFNDPSASPVNSDGTAVNSPYATTRRVYDGRREFILLFNELTKACKVQLWGFSQRRERWSKERLDGERMYYTTPKGARYYLDEWGCCIFDHLPQMAQTEDKQNQQQPQNFEYQRSDSADDSIIRNDVENFANTSLEGQEQQQKVLTTENFGEQKHETESNYANVICQDNALQYGSLNHFIQPPAPFPYQPLAPHSSTPTFGIGFHPNHQQFYQIPPQQLFQPSFMEWGQADPAYQQQQTYVPHVISKTVSAMECKDRWRGNIGGEAIGKDFNNGQQKIDVGVSHDITPPALRTFQTRVDKGNVNPANSPFLEILPPIHANHIMSMLPPHMRSVTTPRVKPKAEAPAPTPFDFKFCENLPTDTVERAIIVLSKPKNGWGLNVKARREEDLHALPPKA
ncbi:hypothetical protein BC829DRAFT_434090 [Chytridium lagenaria]|nr:hypothetical protein BC829DRAFT_434090 [Chytridium lagenaria]